MFNEHVAIVRAIDNLSGKCAALGIVVIDRDTLAVTEKKYFLCSDCIGENIPIDNLCPYELEIKETGEEITIIDRGDMEKAICGWLKDHDIHEFLFYGGGTDKRCLSPVIKDLGIGWFDVSYIAAYQQRNPRLQMLGMPANYFSGTGRLTCGYGLQDMYRMMTGSRTYERSYNAIEEAKDILVIINMIGVPLSAYEKGKK